jgi:hypothetical protein
VVVVVVVVVAWLVGFGWRGRGGLFDKNAVSRFRAVSGFAAAYMFYIQYYRTYKLLNILLENGLQSMLDQICVIIRL